MKPPVALLTDPRSAWARVAREALQGVGEVFITSNEARLKKLIAGHPSGILVIIDARQAPAARELIAEVKNAHPNAVVLVATASRTWDETIALMQAGASDIILKSMDPDELCGSLRPWQAKESS